METKGPLCNYCDNIVARAPEDPEHSQPNVYPFSEIVGTEIYEDISGVQSEYKRTRIIACVDYDYRDAVLEAVRKRAEEIKQQERINLQNFIQLRKEINQ